MAIVADFRSALSLTQFFYDSPSLKDMKLFDIRVQK
jgi:hypothetical protein